MKTRVGINLIVVIMALGIQCLSYCSPRKVIANLDDLHSKWDQILKQYTVKSGNQVYFNYKELKNNIDELNSYLDQLESLSKLKFNTFNRSKKLAFWINAYNAYTIQIILKNYPVKSIRDIKSGFFSSGPWKKDFIQLFGKRISLDDIEHETIRKNFDEPRIHFAVNCASIGCPSLLQEAFVGRKLDTQLDKAANNFLQNKSKNYVKGRTLYLSKIFKWYGGDFDNKYGGFQNYVIKTLGLPKKKYELKFTDYDWSINSVSKQ